MDKLNKTFRAVFEGDRLIKMIFSRKRSKALPYEKISLRPVMSGGSLRYQASYFFGSMSNVGVEHRNESVHSGE